MTQGVAVSPPLFLIPHLGSRCCACSSHVSLAGSSVCHQGQPRFVRLLPKAGPRAESAPGRWQTLCCCHNSNKPKAAQVQASPTQPQDPRLSGQYRPWGFSLVIAKVIFIGLQQQHHVDTEGQVHGSQQSCGICTSHHCVGNAKETLWLVWWCISHCSFCHTPATAPSRFLPGKSWGFLLFLLFLFLLFTVVK